MFVDKERRTLDYHFLLWNFDISKLNKKKFDMFDQKQGIVPIAETNHEDDPNIETPTPTGRKEVEKTSGSACCTIFWIAEY